MTLALTITFMIFGLAAAIGLYFALFMPIEFSGVDKRKIVVDEVRKAKERNVYSGRDGEAKRALEIQAKRMKVERQVDEVKLGITYFEWLTECIRHLRALWTDCSYDEAQFHIEAYMEMAELKFPDPDYVWTLSSARDFAKEVSLDGEDFGANQ